MASRTIVILTGRYTSDTITEHIEAIARCFPQWTIHVVHELAPRRWRPYLRSKGRRMNNFPEFSSRLG